MTVGTETMATYTVTTTSDVVDPSDGKLSLREAVAKANATAGAGDQDGVLGAVADDHPLPAGRRPLPAIQLAPASRWARIPPAG
jgi:CSLREA domain-containing protein